MKRFLLTILSMIIFTYSFAQSRDTLFLPKFDSGYYMGKCFDDNIKNKFDKYLFIQFLSNQGDTMLSILPYKIKKSNNPANCEIMKDTVTKYLYDLLKSADDVESLAIINNTWAILGFDNLTYYELKDSTLSFSVNIIDINTEEIEVFYFDGIIKDDGNEIKAIIYSDKNTFNKGDIILKYIPNEKISKN